MRVICSGGERELFLEALGLPPLEALRRTRGRGTASTIRDKTRQMNNLRRVFIFSIALRPAQSWCLRKRRDGIELRASGAICADDRLHGSGFGRRESARVVERVSSSSARSSAAAADLDGELDFAQQAIVGRR